MTFNFFTVTLGDKQYATDCPYRNKDKIEALYGLPYSHFKRGASSQLPTLTREIINDWKAAQCTN